MANVIALAIGQYNGSFTVTGDIAATGYYSVGQDAKLVSFSGDVTSLGSFAAVVDSGTMKYKLEPASSEAASDLMDAVIAIQELLDGRFATPAPEISGDELFSASTQVSISGPAHADLYYTTDGTTPTSASTAYTEPFSLDATATVKAIAVIDGVASEVASATFTKLAAPTISGETPFAESTEVTMSGPEGATIHYTTDGSTPTSGSTAYTEALTLDATTTVKAVSVKSGVTSAAATKKFTKES
jgi:hypothetical protein